MPGTVMRFSVPVANVSSRLKSLSPSGACAWVRSSGPFSRTRTCRPARTSVDVSGAPPAPLPITTTSTSSSATSSPPVVRVVAQRRLDRPAPVEQRPPLLVGEPVLQVAPAGGSRVAAGPGVDERAGHRVPAQQQQEEARAAVPPGVPAVDPVGGHLVVKGPVHVAGQPQRVEAPEPPPQQAVDEEQAGVVVVGIVLLGSRQHLVDVVDDPDFLVQPVRQWKLLRAAGAVQPVVDLADEPAI